MWRKIIENVDCGTYCRFSRFKAFMRFGNSYEYSCSRNAPVTL